MNSLFNKICLILIISSCISCKEKPKPFTYDYVEIATMDGWIGEMSCKVDSNQVCYVPDDAIFNNWKQTVTIGKLSDTIQAQIDSIAYKVYNYKDKTIKRGCIDCSEYSVIVVKNSAKKIYYSDADNFIDNNVYAVLEKVERMKKNQNFRVADTTLNIEAWEIIAPTLAPIKKN